MMYSLHVHTTVDRAVIIINFLAATYDQFHHNMSVLIQELDDFFDV